MHGADILGLDRGSGRRHRFQRHTTFGTWPWLRPTHFGVHGTNVSYVLRPIGLDGLGSDVFGAMLVPVRSMAVRRRVQELLRVFLELRETVVTAKEIGLPVVDLVSSSLARLHFHAADRINHDKLIRCRREPECLSKRSNSSSRNFGMTRCFDQLPEAHNNHQNTKPLRFCQTDGEHWI